MTVLTPAGAGLPAWLPQYARLYLRHVQDGVSIRELARSEGCHASTISRRMRRIEQRRDDPLIDDLLTRLGDGDPCTTSGAPAAGGSDFWGKMRERPQ